MTIKHSPDLAKDIETFTDVLTQRLADNANKLKLIIHAGTPKTGTSSVQTYLDKKQRKLRGKGILYPNHFHNADAPKHQWLEKNLTQIHPLNLLDNFLAILDNIDNINRSDSENIHTILLSTEGFYNCWWDFSKQSHQLLSVLNTLLELEIWVWFREPLAFANSFYKQCLRNPQIDSIPCYGKDISLAKMLDDSWFQQRLDYLGFIRDCEKLFGKKSMKIFEHQQDTVQTFSKLLGFSTPYDNPTPRQNNSIHSISVDIMRIINRLNLSAKNKAQLMPIFHDLNDELNPYATNNLPHNDVSIIEEKIVRLQGCDMNKIRAHCQFND